MGRELPSNFDREGLSAETDKRHALADCTEDLGCGDCDMCFAFAQGFAEGSFECGGDYRQRAVAEYGLRKRPAPSRKGGGK
jgi:hypothetical protein